MVRVRVHGNLTLTSLLGCLGWTLRSILCACICLGWTLRSILCACICKCACACTCTAAALGMDGRLWAWGCGSNDGRCGVERFLNMAVCLLLACLAKQLTG